MNIKHTLNQPRRYQPLLFALLILSIDLKASQGQDESPPKIVPQSQSSSLSDAKDKARPSLPELEATIEDLKRFSDSQELVEKHSITASSNEFLNSLGVSLNGNVHTLVIRFKNVEGQKSHTVEEYEIDGESQDLQSDVVKQTSRFLILGDEPLSIFGTISSSSGTKDENRLSKLDWDQNDAIVSFRGVPPESETSLRLRLDQAHRWIPSRCDVVKDAIHQNLRWELLNLDGNDWYSNEYLPKGTCRYEFGVGEKKEWITTAFEVIQRSVIEKPELPKLTEMQLPTADELFRADENNGKAFDWIVLKAPREADRTVIVVSPLEERPDTLKKMADAYAQVEASKPQNDDERRARAERLKNLKQLVVKLPGNSVVEYSLPISNIDHIVLFEELMLRRADESLKEGDIRIAYELLLRVEKGFPSLELAQPRFENLLRLKSSLRDTFGGAEFRAQKTKPESEASVNQPDSTSTVRTEQSNHESNNDDTDQIKIFSLKTSNAKDAAKIIESLFGFPSVMVATDERTNSLIIRGDSTSLTEIEAILLRIDSNEPAAKNSATRDLPAADANAPVISIAEYRQRLDALEQPVQQLAEQVRAAEAKHGKDHADCVKLRADLRTLVQQTFVSRQDIQRAELTEFTRRLQRMQQSIDTREKIAEKIVDRRMEELLNPDARWEQTQQSSEQGTTARLSNDRIPEPVRHIQYTESHPVYEPGEDSPSISQDELVASLNQKTAGLRNWRCSDTSVQLRLPKILPQRLRGAVACSNQGQLRVTCDNFIASMDVGLNKDTGWLYTRPGDGLLTMSWNALAASPQINEFNGWITPYPNWLTTLLGVQPLDPARFELQKPALGSTEAWLVSMEEGNGGKLLRHIIKVDTNSRVILSHTLYDGDGKPLLIAHLGTYKTCGKFQLPHHLNLQFPTKSTFLEFSFVAIETNSDLPDALWQRPTGKNLTMVELDHGSKPGGTYQAWQDYFGLPESDAIQHDQSKSVDDSTMPHPSTRESELSIRSELLPTIDALLQDIEEMQNRTPLKLLLQFKEEPLLQISDDFYESVRKLRDNVKGDLPPAKVKESFRSVEFNSKTLVSRFRRFSSHGMNNVLRNIEDGIATLKILITTDQRVGVITHIIAAKNQVEVSLGLDDGNRIGQQLTVASGDHVIGTVEIVTIETDSCVARILNVPADHPIRKGDRIQMQEVRTPEPSVKRTPSNSNVNAPSDAPQ